MNLRCLFLIALAACGSRATGPTNPNHPKPHGHGTDQTEPTEPTPAPEATGNRVLLVITGLSAAPEAITSADVAAGYCAGKIGVLDAVRSAADDQFHCHAPATVLGLDDFAPTAKTHLLVTDLDHVTNQFKALAVDGKSFFTKPHDYPLVLVPPDTTRPDYAPHLTHFILTGVTAITRASGVACDEHGIDWLTQNIREEFAGAEYVHVSNEVSIKKDCEYPVKGVYTFCSKERDFQALIDLHTNIIELTGNHMRDFGDEPMRKTLAWYKDHDMHTFGGGGTPEAANEPLILPLADGKKLGIIGFNESCPLHECAKKPGEVGANAWDSAKAKADIERMRGELGADYVLVTVQFREWDHPQPTKSQAQISHELVEDGADFVYGSQAHEPQYVEFYKGKSIFHGLGNLLFDQIHRIPVRQAFFLHNYFFHGKLVQSVPVFTFMADDRQPTLATPEQAAAVKAVIYKDELLYH